MTWQEEWRSISARIEGYQAAAQLFFAIASERGDYYGVSNLTFIRNARNLKQKINEFINSYSSELPSGAAETAKTFIQNFNAKRYSGIDGVQAASCFLAEFKSEFEFSIAGSVEYAKSLVKRAFIHLQRIIVADHDVRNKWIHAFRSGETACERLGAVHLLSHGLWAFKANAPGERTDLILGKPVNLSDVKESSSILVLTEWKIASNQSSLEIAATDARRQAGRYAMGILAGFELETCRFIVLVSEKNLQPPQDVVDGNVTYRHINIAVDPDAPSVPKR